MKMHSAWRTGLIILAPLLALILLLWPLSKRGFFVSDDGEWMVIRLSAFQQSIREGQFPVRYLGRLNHSYGYPVANFLYPGYLYLGAPLHVIGFTFPDSVKIIFAGSVIGSAYFVFLWLRRYFSSFESGIGTMGYILAPYLTYDLYTRGSVGEVLAFLPASLGMYSIASGNLHMLPFAVALLIVSHNSLAVIFLVLIIAYGWARYGLRIFASVLFGLGMSSFFWIPALYERRYVLFDQAVVSRPFDYFLGTKTALLAGPAAILSWFVLAKRPIWKKQKSVKVMLISFAVFTFLALPLAQPVWTLPLMAKLFQFPFRMLAVSVLAGAWITAGAMHYIRRMRPLYVAVILGFLLLPAAYRTRTVEIVTRPETFYTTNEATTTVADEYMPRWVRAKPLGHANAPLEFAGGSGEIQILKASTQQIAAIIQTDDQSVIQINKIYYPGWGAMVDNTSVDISYDNPQGIMRISVPAGEHRLYAEFRETLFRFVTDIITLISLVAYGIYLVFRQIKLSRSQP